MIIPDKLLRENAYDLKPNSLNQSEKKCMEMSLENLYVNLAA